eukprot:TRINITY_DN6294_c0_g1_i1.p1 TRINITY_DN6294_c0_g1~~TRINITY_DN6294_c0_g1_i1.p1  ORF type:complete len:132 (+),score=28.15 TRINITY_DN6294_c0_g1_i1:98-493(+)
MPASVLTDSMWQPAYFAHPAGQKEVLKSLNMTEPGLAGPGFGAGYKVPSMKTGHSSFLDVQAAQPVEFLGAGKAAQARRFMAPVPEDSVQIRHKASSPGQHRPVAFTESKSEDTAKSDSAESSDKAESEKK